MMKLKTFILILSIPAAVETFGAIEAEFRNCTNSIGTLQCTVPPERNALFRRFTAEGLSPQESYFDDWKDPVYGPWSCYFHIYPLNQKYDVKTVISVGISPPLKFTVLGYWDQIKVLPELGRKCEEFPELIDHTKEKTYKSGLIEAKKSGCDCNYNYKRFLKPGGCKINKPAMQGYACRCQYRGFWTCSGGVVPCDNNDSPSCKNPSMDLESCVQGKGDCGGY